jgi:hypothetical protein
MKKAFFLFLFAALFTQLRVNAQSTIPLDPKGDFKVWSDWHHDTVTGGDGKVYTFDYRVQIAKRQGMAVYYEIEIKNTCSYALSGRIEFNYTTTWLSTPMSESEKFKCKPGASTTVQYIQQGCKKTDKSKSDYQACLECPMDYTIYINTK